MPKNFSLTCFIFFNLLSNFAQGFSIESTEEYQYMDELAQKSGADKGSQFHDYTRIYSNYFKELKNDNITFLEIGIYKGSSVKLWEAYFPNAELHFIDINPNYVEYHSARSHYHFIDQENIAAMKQFAKDIDKPFDIIIDDGGHTMKQQINSFIALFPHLKSGGMYIIEDLHTSYWKEFGGGGTKSKPKAGAGTTIAYLKEKIDDLNSIGAMSGRANFYALPQSIEKKLNKWQLGIRSMHFYDSVCIIIKR